MIDTRKFRNELSDIDKEKLYQKYNLKPENKIVLFTGRLTPDKGILELLEAFNNLNLNNVILLIVGSYYFKSDTHSDFEKQFKDLANSSVRFTGFVEYEDIPKTYQLADIVVLPSIWEDPAPLTVIEALSAGVPLITTDSGGIPEYVKGTDTIVLTRDENLVNNITSSIRNLLNNEYKLSI
ncbi:TPA: glycosyltransferase family 4 protein, partial [Streptococcus suis]